jgi:hypothetical protein
VQFGDSSLPSTAPHTASRTPEAVSNSTCDEYRVQCGPQTLPRRCRNTWSRPQVVQVLALQRAVTAPESASVSAVTAISDMHWRCMTRRDIHCGCQHQTSDYCGHDCTWMQTLPCLDTLLGCTACRVRLSMTLSCTLNCLLEQNISRALRRRIHRVRAALCVMSYTYTMQHSA